MYQGHVSDCGEYLIHRVSNRDNKTGRELSYLCACIHQRWRIWKKVKTREHLMEFTLCPPMRMFHIQEVGLSYCLCYPVKHLIRGLYDHPIFVFPQVARLKNLYSIRTPIHNIISALRPHFPHCPFLRFKISTL